MMKIVKNKSYLKIGLIIGILVALVAASTYGYNTYKSSQESAKPDSTVNSEEPTVEQVNDGEDTIEQDDTGDQQKDSVNDRSAQPNISNPSSQQVDLEITSLNQNADVLQVRALIQSLESGECILTLTRNGETITRTANTQTVTSYNTCQGFNISTNNITKGQWNLKLQYKGSTKEGTTSSSVSIN